MYLRLTLNNLKNSVVDGFSTGLASLKIKLHLHVRYWKQQQLNDILVLVWKHYIGGRQAAIPRQNRTDDPPAKTIIAWRRFGPISKWISIGFGIAKSNRRSNLRMSRWKVWAAIRSPNVMWMNSNNPNGLTIAVFYNMKWSGLIARWSTDSQLHQVLELRVCCKKFIGSW